MPRELRWPGKPLVNLTPDDLLSRYPGGPIYLNVNDVLAPGPISEE
jgi:hypothetical protein